MSQEHKLDEQKIEKAKNLYGTIGQTWSKAQKEGWHSL